MSWTSLTQTQRNQALVNYGLPLVGQNSGQSCKEWVRTVVQNASANAGGPTRIIPATQAPPNDYMWVGDPYVVGQSAPIQNVLVGWILQLRMFNGTPHTFIVSERDATRVRMLDSNWSNNQVIQNHYMTFTDFVTKFQYWSCYYIL